MDQDSMKETLEFQVENKSERFRKKAICFLSAVVLVGTVLLLVLPATTLEQTVDQSDVSSAGVFADEDNSIITEEKQSEQQSLSVQGEDYLVTVTYNDDALIPEDTTLYVREIDPKTEEYHQCYAQTETALSQPRQINVARFFDMSLTDAEGQNVDPAAPMAVCIEYEEILACDQNQSVTEIQLGQEESQLLTAQIEEKENGACTVCFEQSSLAVTGTLVTSPVTRALRGEGVTGIVNSTLEDGEQYIVYCVSGSNHVALTENCGVSFLTSDGNTVTSTDGSVVWTYVAATRSLVNSSGQYLRIGNGSVTTSGSVQSLNISNLSGGTIQCGTYYLRYRSGSFSGTSSQWYATNMLFAKIPSSSNLPFSYSKTVEKVISPQGDQYRLTLSVSAPQDRNTRYTHIYVDDRFSSYAQPIDGEALMIEVTKETGELLAQGGPTLTLPATSVNIEAVVTASYNAEAGRLTLNFPENYVLENGWTYRLSTLIQPTDEAYETYINGLTYPHTGDDGTGTFSSNQEGFYSNQSAQLQYQINDETLVTVDYPMPVIQVNVNGNENYQGTNTSPQGLRLGKYVEKLPGQNDDYQLYITLCGPSKKEKTKVNVLFVLDTTTSMSAAMNGTYNNSYERWNALENAIDFMTEELENLEADPRYSMIWFNGQQSTAQNPYQDAGVASGWTSNRSGFMSTVRSYRNKLGGYTNYEAACYELVNVGTLLNTARSDAKNIVVFVSDGQPNVYYLSEGSSSPYSPNSELTIINARARLNGITNVAAFFTVGVGVESDFVRLEQLAEDLPAKGIITGHYVCTDQAAVGNAFENMIDVVFKPKYSHVILTDELSEYAQLVRDMPYTLQILNENGEVLAQEQAVQGQTNSLQITLPATEINPESTLTLDYDEVQRKFVLSFPDSYILESEWSYRIIANIEPTDFAYNAYSQNGYEHIGDKGTGVTASLQNGFYCNTEATVDYCFNDGDPETQLYPKPVIQVLTAEPGYQLPNTGGVGTWCFRLVGALLAGVCLIGFNIRRQSKNKKVIKKLLFSQNI